MLGMLRMAMPSRKILLRSTSTPSHCKAESRQIMVGPCVVTGLLKESDVSQKLNIWQLLRLKALAATVR